MLDHTPEAQSADDNTHPLTGSTPPGNAAPPFQPVASASEPRRSRGADVMLIRHARRVAELAREADIALSLRSELEARVAKEGPKAPKRPPEPPGDLSIVDQSTKTHKVKVVTIPRRPDPAWEAWEAANAAAKADHRRAVATYSDAIGLTAQEKICDYLVDRLFYQTHALTHMRATSVLALAAKASAYVEIVTGGSDDTWVKDLAVSIAEDVVRVMAVPIKEADGATSGAPDRRALEAYREWLHHEGKMLGDELYGRGGDMIPSNTAAGEFHFPSGIANWRDVPPPSSRAERMCEMLGIDWRSDEPARCARRAQCVEAIADGEVAVVGEVA